MMEIQHSMTHHAATILLLVPTVLAGKQNPTMTSKYCTAGDFAVFFLFEILLICAKWVPATVTMTPTRHGAAPEK